MNNDRRTQNKIHFKIHNKLMRERERNEVGNDVWSIQRNG